MAPSTIDRLTVFAVQDVNFFGTFLPSFTRLGKTYGNGLFVALDFATLAAAAALRGGNLKLEKQRVVRCAPCVSCWQSAMRVAD